MSGLCEITLYVQGTTWDWRARSHRALDHKLQVALAKIHAEGILHGDLHKGNILVAPDNRIFIVDFDGAQLHPTQERLAAEKNDMTIKQSVKVGCHCRITRCFCSCSLQKHVIHVPVAPHCRQQSLHLASSPRITVVLCRWLCIDQYAKRDPPVSYVENNQLMRSRPVVGMLELALLWIAWMITAPFMHACACAQTCRLSRWHPVS